MFRITNKSLLFVLLMLLLVIPSAVDAKNQNIHSGKYARTKERATSAVVSLGEPVISAIETDKFILNEIGITSYKKIETEIDLYPKIAIIRIEPARPFYIFPRAKSVSVTISGLISRETYYLYQEKLRDPIIFEADELGSYSLTLDTPRHRYLILKTSPSTYHIDATATGGDCPQIGTWSASTKTCTLSITATINQIIEIDDGGITLDGAGRVIEHSDDMGIYANRDPIFDDNMADITIKNLTVKTPLMGITMIDLPNGFIQNVSIQNSITGLSLKDDANIKITKNNFISNDSDLSINNSSGTILSNSTERGNFWSKNTDCTQDSANPDHCTDPYLNDNLPWACQSAWLSGINCPADQAPPDTYPGSLQNQAAIKSQELLGAKYTFGAKGYDYATKQFTNSSNIVSDGYDYYNNSLGGVATDTGIDCSGLTTWSFNKTYWTDRKVKFSDCIKYSVGEESVCPIAWEGANGQYLNNTYRISKEDLLPGDFLFFDEENKGDGRMDHVALYIGGETFNVLHSGAFANGPAYAFFDSELEQLVTTKPNGSVQKITAVGYGRISNPNVDFVAVTYSPVTIKVTNPSQSTISKGNIGEEGNPMEYHIKDYDGDGEENDIVIARREIGNYIIEVIPKDGASPSDTYSIVVEVKIDGVWKSLLVADNVEVKDIPVDPYIVRSTADSISLADNPKESKISLCHIPPGNPSAAHVITVNKSAVQAHLKHGDINGNCDSIEVQPKMQKETEKRNNTKGSNPKKRE